MDSNKYTYAVIGSGRQGTATAYDLARYGGAGRIIMADLDEQIAQNAAERINKLIGHTVAESIQLDAGDEVAVDRVLVGVDAVLSGVTYYFNEALTRAAIKAGAHFCDFGGNTDVVMQQLAMHDAAKAAGVSIVPDCGMGPGLNNTMGMYILDLLDETRDILIYDGGLPLDPVPPWNYQCAFHLNGLTNEYYGEAVFLRDGKVTLVDALADYELVDMPELGTLEAVVTTGGTSTVPYTLEGKVQHYENKTVRYQGHFEWFRAFKELGLFEEKSIQVGSQEVVPREFYHTLLTQHISTDVVKDICVMRVKGVGVKTGRETTVYVDLVDRYDEQTGFTAMERLTGWHAAIMMGFQVRGDVPAGAVRMELAVSAEKVMQAFAERDISHQIHYESNV